MTRFGIIGTGSLGTSLLRAAATHAPEIGLFAANRDPSQMEKLRCEIPGLLAATPEDLAKAADLVVLCVSPDAYLALCDRIAPHLGSTIVISVTNTIPLASIAERVRVPVVKVIPTLAHVVGRGVSLLVAGPGAKPEDVEAVRRVFARFSVPIMIDARNDRVASNVAGSALALFAALCDAFVSANAARTETLARPVLDAMMAETVGAIAALANAGYGWGDIVRATATPGGMTQAALDVLASQFPQIANDMVAATFARQAEFLNRKQAIP
jgi:pyrroline-5-carboxylate reductase